MTTSQIIAGAFALCALIFPLVLQESIKEAIKKSFSDLSVKQVRQRFIVGLVVLFVIVSTAGFGISTAIEEEQEEPLQQEAAAETGYQNDTIQAIVDLTKMAIEKGQEWTDNKRNRDSAALANREKYWVYCIGNPQDDGSAAWDAAMEVVSIGDISIFKNGRKNFAIICDPGLDEQSLQDSLNNYEIRLDALGVNARIELIDLMSYCSKKETLVETDPVKRKKQDESFNCLTCDK